MQAQGHQVVHDIVFACDRVKHPAHTPGLVLFIDGFEAEIGAGHGNPQ
jgi:hypothetical protein